MIDNVKIITDYCEGTSGDCISHYKCHLQTPVTLKQFIDYVISDTKEWGYIYVKGARDGHGGHNIAVGIEYRHGKVLTDEKRYDKYLNLIIQLERYDGGWSRSDYSLIMYLNS